MFRSLFLLSPATKDNKSQNSLQNYTHVSVFLIISIFFLHLICYCTSPGFRSPAACSHASWGSFSTTRQRSGDPRLEFIYLFFVSELFLIYRSDENKTKKQHNPDLLGSSLDRRNGLWNAYWSHFSVYCLTFSTSMHSPKPLPTIAPNNPDVRCFPVQTLEELTADDIRLNKNNTNKTLFSPLSK